MSTQFEGFFIAYTLFVFCFVFPPPAFKSLGLTIPELFREQLPDRKKDFVVYELKRCNITIAIHSLMYLGFVFGLKRVLYKNSFGSFFDFENFGSLLLDCLCAPVFLLLTYMFLTYNKLDFNPAAIKLERVYERDWHSLARSINHEYETDVDLVVAQSGNNQVIVTQSWLLYCTTYQCNIIHHRGLSLTVTGSNYVPSANATMSQQQMIFIQVKNDANTESFPIILNSLDYNRVQGKVNIEIQNVAKTIIRHSVEDEFLDIFQGMVIENTKTYMKNRATVDSIIQNSVSENDNEQDEDEDDLCVGCLNKSPNAMLKKLCPDESESSNSGGLQNCSQCKCTRRLWCTDCLAAWFLSQQKQKDSWLSGKAACPTCRVTFCAYDVCRHGPSENNVEVNF